MKYRNRFCDGPEIVVPLPHLVRWAIAVLVLLDVRILEEWSSSHIHDFQYGFVHLHDFYDLYESPLLLEFLCFG